VDGPFDLMLGLKFAVGVAIVYNGVRMILADLIPAFQGIATKIIPNSIPAVDCAVFFTFAQTAVIIGFIFSFIGGIIGMIILGISGGVLIIPGLVPHFFCGATAGIYGNWFPIIIGIIFAVAHLPVAITKNIASSSDYDFNFDSTTTNSRAIIEIGQFLTAFLLVSGVYLPILLNHSLILTKTAMVLTIVGGLLIYGTVYTFSHYFDEPQEEDGLADLGGGVI